MEQVEVYLEKEIVIGDFMQLYRQSVAARAQIEQLRLENMELKAEIGKSNKEAAAESEKSSNS